MNSQNLKLWGEEKEKKQKGEVTKQRTEKTMVPSINIYADVLAALSLRINESAGLQIKAESGCAEPPQPFAGA